MDSNSLMLTAAGLSKDDIGMVSGVLYGVESFEKWLSEYRKVSEGLIIALRNVDDPKLTLVFEGSKTYDLAKNRVELLTSEEFINQSSAFDSPLPSYFSVRYFDKGTIPVSNYVALSYREGGELKRDWLAFVRTNQDFFESLQIEPAGIGIDPENYEHAYLLFRQKDYVAFKKAMNSPRKIDKFLDSLKLPEQTLISYWFRISESAN